MRYTALTFLMLVFCGPALGQQPSPTIEDYETYFKKYKEYSDNAFNPSHWKNLSLTNNKTGEVKKFSELTKLEQHSVMLMLGDRFTREMTSLADAWNKEVKKFDDPKHTLVPRPKIESEKQKPAMKDEVVKFCSKLTDMRKKFAEAYEKYAESMVKNFEKDIDEKERAFIMQQIRDFHDEHKLVDRTKKDKK